MSESLSFDEVTRLVVPKHSRGGTLKLETLCGDEWTIGAVSEGNLGPFVRVLTRDETAENYIYAIKASRPNHM